MREGWLLGKIQQETTSTDNAANMLDMFKKVLDSLMISYGYLLYGELGCIPVSLQLKVLVILVNCGMRHVKRLARTSVYWPGFYCYITELSHKCHASAEHQKMPRKQPVHH